MEEEIDLREYINVLIKRKWLIICILILALLAAGIVSFFILDPVYEATATLLFHKPRYEVTLEPKIRTQASQDISLETYEHLIKDKDIEERIIEELNLKQPPYEMTFLNLNKMLSVNLIKDSNLIQMKMTSADPELAQKIVNLWADLYVEKNQNIFQKDNERASLFIEDQLNKADEELIKTDDEIRQFNSTNRIDMLQKEINQITDETILNQSRVDNLKIYLNMEKNKSIRLWQQLIQSRLVYFQSRKANLELITAQQKNQFTKVSDLLSGLEEKTVLSKSMIEDPYLQEIFQTLLDQEALSLYQLKVSSEEINPIYVQLTEHSHSLEMDIVNNEAEIEAVNRILAFLSEEIITVNQFFQEDIGAMSSLDIINQINDSLIRVSMNDINLEIKMIDDRNMEGDKSHSILSSIELIESMENEIAQLDHSIREARVKIVSLKDDLANESLIKTRLERKYENEKSIYDILTQKNEETKIALSAESTNLEVAKYAFVPETPIKPNKKLNLAIAGVMGLFLGIFIAFFMEFWQGGKE